jgi:hypothetical protein
MTIKPIGTEYRGCKFRSRLEARWAVAFDLHQIRYVYEPEAYPLPSGAYLPDFWIPQWDAFAEVKRGRFTELEKNKCKELAEATGKDCVLLDGTPTCGPYPVMEAKLDENEKVVVIEDFLYWHVLIPGRTQGSSYPWYSYECELSQNKDRDLEADHPEPYWSRSRACAPALNYRFWNPK